MTTMGEASKMWTGFVVVVYTIFMIFMAVVVHG